MIHRATHRKCSSADAMRPKPPGESFASTTSNPRPFASQKAPARSSAFAFSVGPDDHPMVPRLPTKYVSPPAGTTSLVAHPANANKIIQRIALLLGEIVNRNPNPPSAFRREAPADSPPDNDPGWKILQTRSGRFFIVDADFTLPEGWYALHHLGHSRYSESIAIYQSGSKRRAPLHRYILGARVGQIVDHINGEPLDNRRRNLRFVTTSQSRMNSASTGGKRFKGTRYDRRYKRFYAVIAANGRRYFGPYVQDELSAARDANELMLRHHGEFARLNVL